MAKVGRPSTYPKDEADALCRKVIECGRQGMSEVEIAVEIGQPRSTMQRWAENNLEFAAALTRAKEASQAWWERKARDGSIGSMAGQINPAAWKHTVNCRFKADYGDRIEHGGSLNLNVIDRFGEGGADA